MKVVGLFRELGRGIDQSIPSIHAAVGALPKEKAMSIVRYLSSGIPVFDVMEATEDPLNSSVRIPGGPSLISDGTWVWRRDLEHFVSNYRVSLPDEFVAHACERICVSEAPSSVVARWQEAIAAYDLAERGLPSE